MGFLPRVFNARAGDFYRKIFFATRAKETRELALPEGEKSLTICMYNYFDPIPAFDRKAMTLSISPGYVVA